VVRQLGGHPGAMDLTVGRVMQDVQPYRAPEELTHESIVTNIVLRYRIS
jgi:hypothetical protein